MAERAAMSLTVRVALAVGALLMVGGIVVSLAAFAYGRQAAREAFDRLLVGAANDIAASITIVDGAPLVDLPVSAFDLLALAADDRIAYQVTGPNGATLTGYTDLPSFPEKRVEDTAFFDAPFGSEPARYIRVTRRFAERSFSGTVHVVVGHTLNARNELALDITRNALLALTIAGLAMVALAAVVVRSALRPLERIAAAFSGRDPHDLTPMDARVPAEAAVMVRALNGFMARLSMQVDASRHLISDTAHQLRTPVAALRAQADLALHENDVARRDGLIRRMHERSVGLGRLLDQLLSRALVIHRIDAARRELFDLRDVAVDIVEAGDHALIAPGVELRLEVGETAVMVRADALSVSEAAKNLLANALQHGKAPVTLGVEAQGDLACLWIADAGAGPPAEIRKRLGQRFANQSDRGSGLGLSIAQSVAEAFGGTLALDDQGGGFRITLRLPLERRP